MTDLTVLCPGYPDRPGGVTDHTTRILRRWRARGIGAEAAATLPAATRDPVPPLLVQYVPFLYGRRGLSPELVRTVEGARARRVTLFVHEPWVPPTRLPWLVLSPLQRRQLFRLARSSSAVVTPVPAWQAMLPEGTGVAYVGHTLAASKAPLPREPRLPAPVVFSPFAAGMEWSWILAAVQAVGASPPLIVLGASLAEARARRPLGHLRANPEAWDWRGRLEPGEVLALLARAPLVLAPFADGMTGRRTSAFAALSVGAPVLSSRGPLFDPVFEAGPVGLADARTEFAEMARAWWNGSPPTPDADARRAWHDAHFDPDVLDDRLLELVMGRAS